MPARRAVPVRFNTPGTSAHRPKPPDSIQHGHVVMLTELAHIRELRVALAAARGYLAQADPPTPAARPDIQFFAFFSAN